LVIWLFAGGGESELGEREGEITAISAAKVFKKMDIERGFGCAGYTGKTKSLNDMDQAIDDDIRQQWHKA